ncbi:MAG TPA: hypothetical protein VFG63_08795 [Nocardioidaceae bacterium]|nr:hypothetical protein [Nocardioidaceae bacterium]
MLRALVGAAAVLLATGCADTTTPSEQPRPSPSSLGGAPHPAATPPARPMRMVERTIAEDLSGRLVEEDLSVDYLDCPDLREDRPVKVVCDGYIDGVLADVRVRLWGPADDRRYDARLGTDILVTANLVSRLAAEGYHRIDCGDRPAYPTVVGDRIVCSVTRHREQRYVVALVTTKSGKVRISDF